MTAPLRNRSDKAANLTAATLPPPRFDRIARLYRWLEYLTLGRALERTRTQYLARLAGQRSALVLGDGDGRFAAALLRSNPQVQVLAVDASAEMLRLLRTRAAFASSRLCTLHADARTLTPEQLPVAPFDLVATHFFLDCLHGPEVDALSAIVASALAPGGLWVVSEFHVAPGLRGWPAALLVRALYLAFRLLTGLRVTRLPDHAAALAAQGLVLVDLHHSLAGLLTAELWQKPPHPPLPPAIN